MIFNYQTKAIEPKVGQIGPAGGEVLQIGIEKQGSRRGQLDVCPGTGTFQAHVFPAPLGVKLRKCQLRGPRPIHNITPPHLRPQRLFYPYSFSLFKFVKVCEL